MVTGEEETNARAPVFSLPSLMCFYLAAAQLSASLLSALNVIMRYPGLYEVQKYMHSALTKPISRMGFMGHTIALLKRDLPPRLTGYLLLGLSSR
jgi:hypothetical protein